MPKGPTVYPGLLEEMLMANFKKTSKPKLSKILSERDEKNKLRSTAAEWSAKGSNSNVYTITALGSYGRENKLKDLSVTCSCPDGARREPQSRASFNHGGNDRVSVCKHAYAALSSAVDKKAALAVKTEKANRKKAKLKAQKRQDAELPGERERILHGFKHLGAEKVLSLLNEELESFDGLRRIIDIFDENKMPKPQILHCLRCDEDFDENFSNSKSCVMHHPEECSETVWESSKKSYDYCSRCDNSFNADGFHSWGRNSVQEVNHCFVGSHTTNPDVVAAENWLGTE